jgi:hypothetical protein
MNIGSTDASAARSAGFAYSVFYYFGMNAEGRAHR